MHQGERQEYHQVEDEKSGFALLRCSSSPVQQSFQWNYASASYSDQAVHCTTDEEPRFQQKADARILQAHLFDGLVQDQADCDIKRALIDSEREKR